MHRFAIAVLVLAAACGQQKETAPAEPVRTAIEYRVVKPDRLPVHEKPDANAKAIAEYRMGETMSVLALNGEWAEVRVGSGSGWVKAADLASQNEQQQVEADNTQPRFLTPPNAVVNNQARGEIVIEANVNTDGEVTSTRVISNTTGNKALEILNTQALTAAKFAPVVRNGQREPFIYEHRVTY